MLEKTQGQLPSVDLGFSASSLELLGINQNPLVFNAESQQIEVATDFDLWAFAQKILKIEGGVSALSQLSAQVESGLIDSLSRLDLCFESLSVLRSRLNLCQAKHQQLKQQLDRVMLELLEIQGTEHLTKHQKEIYRRLHNLLWELDKLKTQGKTIEQRAWQAEQNGKGLFSDFKKFMANLKLCSQRMSDTEARQSIAEADFKLLNDSFQSNAKLLEQLSGQLIVVESLAEDNQKRLKPIAQKFAQLDSQYAELLDLADSTQNSLTLGMEKLVKLQSAVTSAQSTVDRVECGGQQLESDVKGLAAKVADLRKQYLKVNQILTSGSFIQAGDNVKLQRVSGKIIINADRPQLPECAPLPYRPSTPIVKIRQGPAPKCPDPLPELAQYAIAVDVTGSMQGTLDALKAKVKEFVRNMNGKARKIELSFIAYGDKADRKPIQLFPMTEMNSAGISALEKFLNGVQLQAGGDWPENPDLAWKEINKLPWKRDVPNSVVFIGDAESHASEKQFCMDEAKAFANGGPKRAVSTFVPGANAPDSAKNFMQSMANNGRGKYKVGINNLAQDLAETLPK